MIHTALFVMLGAFLAALLRGFTGFGFVMAAVPLLSLGLPPTRVVPLAILMQIEVGLIDLPVAMRLCDWRSLAWLAPGMVLGTPLGLLVLTSLSAGRARLAIGLLIAGSVAVLAYGVRLPERPSRWLTLGVGMVSGTMSGLAGISGPPVVAYLLALPHRYRGGARLRDRLLRDHRLGRAGADDGGGAGHPAHPGLRGARVPHLVRRRARGRLGFPPHHLAPAPRDRARRALAAGADADPAGAGAGVIPAASSAGRYRAWGWRGGHAQNQGHTSG